MKKPKKIARTKKESPKKRVLCCECGVSEPKDLCSDCPVRGLPIIIAAANALDATYSKKR